MTYISSISYPQEMKLIGQNAYPVACTRYRHETDIADIADIDMKLGMTLRTSILRRLVKEKSDLGKENEI